MKFAANKMNFEDWYCHIQYMFNTCGSNILQHSHLDGNRLVESTGFHLPEAKSEYMLQWSLVKGIKPESILEIGSANGISAVMWNMLCPKVTTLSYLYYPHFDAVTKNLEFTKLTGDSLKELPALINEKRTFDFIFIDGNHRYEFAKADFENSLKLKPRFILMHDTSKIAGPRTLIEELKGKYNLTKFEVGCGLTLINLTNDAI